ncbi:MAG: hypothetical protein Hyperionvirus35_6 [Hyperionvirus sp.]|uniref:Chromosome condensation regulator n=1 Tax=Hyperionvirus sp. TaxID=2487770 RepID=A0A3G5ABY9_9VIRU|nr:MAG: hypothetical protein Hyperionvirus35_6 [Hyperionvirus sp.]
MNPYLIVIKLPKELQYIVESYEPGILFFTLKRRRLREYDWFRLIQMNYSLVLPRGLATNKEIMDLYLDRAMIKRSQIVCCGDRSYIKLGDGQLSCCGDHFVGEFGRFTGAKGLDKNIVEVSCGNDHTIIRLSDGRLMGCGRNNFGELGNLPHSNYKFLELEGIPKNVAEVICYFRSTMIRLADGTLLEGGDIDGVKVVKNFRVIENIPKNIAEVSWGSFDIIIRFTDGSLMGKGDNDSGELGMGDNKQRMFFEKIVIPKNVDKVSCGDGKIIIRLVDGTLMGCGFNKNGELGLGDNRNRSLFEKIPGIPKGVAEIIFGSVYTIIRFIDGTAMSSGYNGFGELGLGDCVNRNVFTKIEVKGIVAEIAACYRFTILRLKDGSIFDTRDKKNRAKFLKVGGVKKIVGEIKSGWAHVIVRLTDGTFMSSGRNNNGQLGIGLPGDRTEFCKILI